ncbi:MAG: FAD-dependent oxidoreductase [Eubacteriales bacterium]|nr:FAD-dependent oxidoreductase [Eubacteriales bacterium]
MRIIIIGAVAAGTSAAAKARRNDEDAEIVVYERDGDISYSGCGMPYYLGGVVKNADELTPRDPAFFRQKYNVEIHARHEVAAIYPAAHTVEVRNLETGAAFTDHYDRLVIATGAKPFVPPITGRERAFTLRSIEDMRRIEAFLETRKPKTAAIIGTGFIGLEVCENLQKRGIAVTLLEKLSQVTPGLDPDMAAHVQTHLESNGVTVWTGVSVQEITDNGVRLADGRTARAELALIATGVRPNTALAASTGIELGETGAIRVDMRMRTNIPDVYACGDCVELPHLVTGRPVYRPLGSTANKTGRIAGDSLTGGDLAFRGILGTGIFRVFEMTVAQTGLTEREALAAGYDIAICHNIKPDRPTYLGGQEMVIKGIADRVTGRMLGAQIVGGRGVDKRIDVLATAITFGATAEDLFHLDLAYAPPFSTTKDPVMYTGMILENAIHRGRPLMTAEELDRLAASGKPFTVVDARVPAQYEKSRVPGAVNIPHERIRAAAKTLNPDQTIITYCNKGTTGNAAQNILLGKGFKRVYNLSGGEKQYRVTHRGKKQEDFS